MRTLQRALDILYCYTLEEQELSLTEISKKIQLAKSTTTRLLSTLELNNLLTKNPNTLKYRLGPGLYYLGHISGMSIKLREIAKPIMEKLRDKTHETVNMYLLDKEFRICMEQCEGLNSIRHLVKIGEKLPLWAGAGGKVMLAYQTAAFQENIFKQIPIKEKLESLKKELVEIKVKQCAVSIDEREVGSAAIAAPIFNIDLEVEACISISGPTVRFTDEVIEEYCNLARAHAMTVSQGLGYINEGERYA